MRGIVSKNIENCKKKLLLQKLREHSQSFQFFVHGVGNATHAHRFFLYAPKNPQVYKFVFTFSPSPSLLAFSFTFNWELIFKIEIEKLLRLPCIKFNETIRLSVVST